MELDRLNRIRFESRQLWSPLFSANGVGHQAVHHRHSWRREDLYFFEEWRGFRPTLFLEDSIRTSKIQHFNIKTRMCSESRTPSKKNFKSLSSLFFDNFRFLPHFFFFVYCGLFSFSRFLLRLNKSLTGYVCGGGAGLTGAVGLRTSSAPAVPFVNFFRKGTLRMLGRN